MVASRLPAVARLPGCQVASWLPAGCQLLPAGCQRLPGCQPGLKVWGSGRHRRRRPQHEEAD
eukprot:1895843-Prymnesium_polylepis.1